jgi:Cu(I)/Ag(I) efflux system periplasmic protein CusF
MKRIIVAISAATFAAAPHALAQSDHASHHEAGKQSVAQSAQTSLTEGVVRKVDKQVGKVTIAHGPIESLGMPKMTMAYRVKDPAMLAGLKAGDKIRFAVDKIDGEFAVIKLEAAK